MKLVFLANSFHLTRTKSSLFFIDLLSEAFEVKVVPHKEAWSALPDPEVEVLVAWQHQYLPQELEAFGVPRVVLVPMYDDCPHTEEYWKRYTQFSVLSFCAALKGILDSAGVRNLGVQYYSPLGQPPGKDQNLGGFFWQRSEKINWTVIKSLWGSQRPGSFFFHYEDKPGYQRDLPSEEEQKSFHISFSHWFENIQDLKEKIRTVPVYFAPREREGIGMSFLEALAEGRCVVAPHNPTMTEYITHGIDGLLYDPGNPSPLDFSRVSDLGAAAYKRAQTGREAWEKTVPAIVDFIKATPSVVQPRHKLIHLKQKLIWNLRVIFRFLKSLVGR